MFCSSQKLKLFAKRWTHVMFSCCRSSCGVPLGIISKRLKDDTLGQSLVLCSRLDKCIGALTGMFPGKPPITELKSFKPNKHLLYVSSYFFWVTQQVSKMFLCHWSLLNNVPKISCILLNLIFDPLRLWAWEHYALGCTVSHAWGPSVLVLVDSNTFASLQFV